MVKTAYNSCDSTRKFAFSRQYHVKQTQISYSGSKSSSQTLRKRQEATAI